MTIKRNNYQARKDGWGAGWKASGQLAQLLQYAQGKALAGFSYCGGCVKGLGTRCSAERFGDKRRWRPVVLALLLLAFSQSAAATLYGCAFQTGEFVETEFPCEPAMVNAFGARLIELYPDVQSINTSPDYIMGLYIFSMASCTGRFAMMTPEEIGRNGEPYFPMEMLAAMVRAGREVICPARIDSK